LRFARKDGVLRRELETVMRHMGTPEIASITPDFVAPAGTEGVIVPPRPTKAVPSPFESARSDGHGQ
jgi:hypothetical protein